MRKYRIAALLVCAAMALTAAVGCSDKNSSSSSSSGTYKVSEDGKNDGLADNEISMALSETAKANETSFTLNKVVDSGMRTDSGERYIFLDITIDNSTDKEYEMSILNNFYILFADGSEAHFDVRTQLYAAKNMTGYVSSPFTVPANGQFSGLVGGFLVGSDVNEFTVGFFPTLDDDFDKSSVIKVKVTSSDIVTLSSAN